MSGDGKRGKTWTLQKSGVQPKFVASVGKQLEHIERRFFTLSEVQERIAHYLQPALSAPPFWVVGELSGVSTKAGNLYFDLAESHQGELVAKLRCTVWRGDSKTMTRRFQQNNLTLEWSNGAHVGLLCRLVHHRIFGLSLRAIDIDPDQALGDIERRRRKILERLTQEGLLRLNRQRPLSLLPTRIGLLASHGTSGCKDFLQTVRMSRYGFTIFHADVRVQGAETQASVLNGLRTLQALDLDLIVLVRGGGSRTDLGYLDNEEIAREIARCAVPVWTGIGHETDTSVLDLVAAEVFRTPSAAAGALVARFERVEHQLADLRSRLLKAAELRVAPARHALTGLEDGIRRGTHARIQNCRGQQSMIHLRFSGRALTELGESREQLTGIGVRLNSLTRERLKMTKQRLAVDAGELGKAAQRQILRQRALSLGLASRLEVDRVLKILGLRRQTMGEVRQRLVGSSARRLRERRTELSSHSERLGLERFLRILGQQHEEIDDCRVLITSQSRQRIAVVQQAVTTQGVELKRLAEAAIAAQRNLSQRLASQVVSKHVLQRLYLLAQTLHQLRERLALVPGRRVQDKRVALDRERARFGLERFLRIIGDSRASFEPWLLAIKSADPQTTLERGFALVYNDNGALISSVEGIQPGQRSTIQLRDGKIKTTVEEVRTE